MVEILYTHVCKWINDTCWNYSRNEGKQDKGDWWKNEFKFDIRTFVSFTLHPQYNKTTRIIVIIKSLSTVCHLSPSTPFFNSIPFCNKENDKSVDFIFVVTYRNTVMKSLNTFKSITIITKYYVFALTITNYVNMYLGLEIFWDILISVYLVLIYTFNSYIQFYNCNHINFIILFLHIISLLPFLNVFICKMIQC
jgi:hypothetical protein